jgi:hypothetical protein
MELLRMTDNDPLTSLMIAGANVGFRIANLPYGCVGWHG